MATPAGWLADWLSCLAAMSGGLAYHFRYNHASVHIIALLLRYISLLWDILMHTRLAGLFIIIKEVLF